MEERFVRLKSDMDRTVRTDIFCIPKEFEDVIREFIIESGFNIDTLTRSDLSSIFLEIAIGLNGECHSLVLNECLAKISGIPVVYKFK